MKEFLIPVSDELAKNNYASHQLGSQIIKHTLKEGYPQLEPHSIALFGIISHTQKASLLQQVRPYFYSLASHFHGLKIYDLGDIIEGSTFEDTCEAITQITLECFENQVVPIYIGIEHKETIAYYNAFERLKKIIDIALIDATIDVDNFDNNITEANWILSLIQRDPNYIFNLSLLAYQSYYVSEEVVDLMEKLYFDALRLGKIHANLAFEAEPLLRAADLVSVDLKSIRFADLPASNFYSPNGLSGEEICQLMRFAGMSERVSALGIYGGALFTENNHPVFSRVSYQLLSQMIWYFIFGFFNAPNEDPYLDRSAFIKYIVTSEKFKTDLIFYKSMLSERWWVEVPFLSKFREGIERHLLLPCTYQDYQNALNENIPVRWLKTFQKLS